MLIINISQEVGGKNMKIQLIRHATHILYINNKKILIDPMLSPKGAMPAIEDVPNKKQ